LVSKNSNEIILDAYNANPSSIKVAIENFDQIDKSSKIAVLGDMFELGKESLEEHRAIVEMLSNKANITTYFIGNDFYENRSSQSNFHFFREFEDFAAMLKAQPFRDKMILIKGSRGMALERTLELL
jgi:UDP-N-acetylmuramoyl-tripeptide--D-alanyl-D-alanine ligase